MTRSVRSFYSTDETGAIIPQAEISVNFAGGAEAPIYTVNSGGTPVSQPLISTSSGKAVFYVEPGVYDIESKDPISLTTSTFSNEEIGTSRADLSNDTDIDYEFATTEDLINNVFDTPPEMGSIANSKGFGGKGDGGKGSWKCIENTGAGVPLQSPAQLGDALLNDGNGNQWALVIGLDLPLGALGAVSNGVVDETLIAVAASNATSALGGGIVRGEQGKSYLFDSFTIAPMVGFEGNFIYADPRSGTLLNTASSIRLKEGATITESEGSSLEKWIILKEGMTFPQEPIQIAAWTGTAVKVGASAHGTYNGRLTIVGFDTAIDSDSVTNTEQPRCEHINFDCNNGIHLANVLDIAYIDHCHGWPIASVGAIDSNPERSGNAYRFSAGGDWNKIESSFSYGYKRGLLVEDCNDVQSLNCGFDNDVALTNTIGIEWSGNSDRGNIIACQTAAQVTAIRANIDAGNQLNIGSSHQWTSGSHSILVDGGDVNINANTAFNSPRGLTVNSAASIVSITGASSFDTHSTADIDNLAGSGNLFISPDTLFKTVASGTSPVLSQTIIGLTSAETINLIANHHTYSVVGSTDINTISGGWPGRELTLIFTGTLNLGSGAGNIVGGTIAATSTSAIKLINDNGGNWRQI